MEIGRLKACGLIGYCLTLDGRKSPVGYSIFNLLRLQMNSSSIAIASHIILSNLSTKALMMEEGLSKDQLRLLKSARQN